MELDTELTDSEVIQVGDFLGKVPDGPIPNAEALDGFIAALICCPDLVTPIEYMAVLLNDEQQDDQDAVVQFENEKEIAQFYKLVIRHWNDVRRQLRSGGVYVPLVLDDEDGKFQANDWAQGFLYGTRLRHEIWVGLMKDEEGINFMIPIWTLAHEHDDDPEMRPFDEPITEDRREDLLIEASLGVMGICNYFLEQQNHQFQSQETFARSGRKTGRNAPCPCGSGRKFKQCCGRRPMLN